MKDNKWLRLLAYVTGLVNQEPVLQNEYLAPENRVLRAHLPARLRLSDAERSTLAGIGKRLGRKALAEVAQVAKPDTILAWYQRLIASKIRWLQAPPLSRTAPDRIAERSPSRPNGPGEFRLGGMTGLSAHFPTWVTGCRTRRLPTFSAGMGLSRHANGIKTRPGRSSSSPTSRFWPESTSSQSLCSLGVA
jgi:hypothetical protein